MKDNITKHPKSKERQAKDAVKEFAAMMDAMKRYRRRPSLGQIAAWSFLLFITTASISGAVWAVASLVRWL